MLGLYHSETIARIYFWPFVDTRGGPDACWPWKGALSHTAQEGLYRTYGTVRAFDKIFPAHRYSLELKIGEALRKRWALHNCDNPPCCNPAHLRPGTAKENAEDKTARGRHRVAIETCVICWLSKGICECWKCRADAIGPDGMNDPEVHRLEKLLSAELKRREEAEWEAEMLEEQYLDLADEYVSKLLSVPRPTTRMRGLLRLHYDKQAEEEASFIASWREARAAMLTCEGRGRYAMGDENRHRSHGRSQPLGLPCWGCGAPPGEACRPKSLAAPHAPTATELEEALRDSGRRGVEAARTRVAEERGADAVSWADAMHAIDERNRAKRGLPPR